MRKGTAALTRHGVELATVDAGLPVAHLGLLLASLADQPLGAVARAPRRVQLAPVLTLQPTSLRL